MGSNGKAVTFTGPPERIVAIDSAAVEVLFAIGEGSRVVGTHDFVTFPPETAQVQRVGSAFALNLEQIAILEPDLIFIFFESPVADLETLGVPVLYSDPPADLGEVADNIRLWGEIIGEVEKADGLALEFEASIAEIQERLSQISEGPRVYHDEAPGLWTTGSGSLADQVYSFLKAENVFRDMEGYAQISAEELVARDPQVIISVHVEGPEIFRGNPAFSGISAVVNGRLIAIDGSLLGVPGPRVVLGIQEIAKALYPDLFE
ncbi:MAG: ABC transporter substrate-binding protein [Chloroflexi bacterium]|nr:ABC transporter substrate-binding protein [Chloroflexota bacterium]